MACQGSFCRSVISFSMKLLISLFGAGWNGFLIVNPFKSQKRCCRLRARGQSAFYGCRGMSTTFSPHCLSRLTISSAPTLWQSINNSDYNFCSKRPLLVLVSASPTPPPTRKIIAIISSFCLPFASYQSSMNCICFMPRHINATCFPPPHPRNHRKGIR